MYTYGDPAITLEILEKEISVKANRLVHVVVLAGTSRETDGGAKQFLNRLVVRAAPFALVALAPLALTAQAVRQGSAVQLKNWTAPLYWQPNQVEREALGRAEPQLKFSANAVSADALTFVAITPCRLVDTRGLAAGFNGIAPFSGPSIAATGTLTIPVQSGTEAGTNTVPAPCGTIPSIAGAYSLNLTVVPHAGGAVDYVSLWPAGGTQPFVSTLDDPQGAIVSNAVIVAAGTPTGGISVYNSGPASTDVIIDMNGYFAAPTDLNDNTAIGVGTLANNTSGSDNTATGFDALSHNTTGGNNTASGYLALTLNTTGGANTASGVQALYFNTSGSDNTANGVYALLNNTTGNNNTANGDFAMAANTTGSSNTASGLAALNNNTIGSQNTASGVDALVGNTTGGNNVAIGYEAAQSVSGGNSNNIHIGSSGASGDNGVIKIGEQGTQTTTFIAGVSGAAPGTPNLLVCVDGSGQLGTTGCSSTPSSRRFKEQITDMGAGSSKLLQLRPVTFFYKPEYDDGSHTLQYGLIAEEVSKVYPEMVGYDKDGRPWSVKYQSLAPMLLNEVQKQAAQNRRQTEQIHSLEERLAALEALLSGQGSTVARAAGSQ
jgi:hypothetical protein